VIAYLVMHHDALRTRFRRTGGTWEQENAGREDQRIFAVVDLSLVPDRCRMETMEEAARSLQASLNFKTGPMLRVTQFQCGDGDESRLLMAVHHLVIDVVSWHILLDDMQTAYRQLRDGKPVRLPLKTTSFQTWARTLVAHASAAGVQRERSYWAAQAQSEVWPLPVDFADGANSVASTRAVSISLTRKETRNLLETLPAMTGAQVSDALLAALAAAITRWTGSRTTLVNLEGHGREEIDSSLDLSRTVGWFTACYPVALHSGMDMSPGQMLQSVGDSVRKVPERGLGYGLLRYINKDQAFAQKVQNQPQPEINFNYLGQITDFDSESAIFAPAPESPGPMQNESESRFYTFEIAASILGGSLKVTWNYSANLHRPSTIEQLADSFLVVLREFASGQAIAESGSAAPMVSDLDLTAKELAAITSRVTAHKSKRE
jgi:non-ribosomal peptide synthase protein (TIGR01720 family)